MREYAISVCNEMFLDVWICKRDFSCTIYLDCPYRKRIFLKKVCIIAFEKFASAFLLLNYLSSYRRIQSHNWLCYKWEKEWNSVERFILTVVTIVTIVTLENEKTINLFQIIMKWYLITKIANKSNQSVITSKKIPSLISEFQDNWELKSILSTHKVSTCKNK